MKYNRIRNAGLAAFLWITAWAFSGCMTPQQTQQFNQEMAMEFLQDGYSELDLVVADVDKGAFGGAEWHFKKALNDFEQSIHYFQKLDTLSSNDQAGLKKLHVAVTSLQLCVKYVDQDNEELAVEYYNQATEAFAEAAVLMNAP